MPITYLTDEKGFKIRVREVDGGYTFPWEVLPNHDEEFRSMKTWKARPDDVMICAYPKSGTNWLYEIISMLLSQKAERVKSIKQNGMLDYISQEQFNQLPSPRVLNSHSLFSQLPVDFTNKQCKIVHVVRNPKDVAVSFYHHHWGFKAYEYDGDLESYLPRFIKGNIDYSSWFDYTIDWEKTMSENPDYPIHLMFYEDMIDNIQKEIFKLTKFLGVDAHCTLDFVNKVAELCSIDKMRADKGLVDGKKEGSLGMFRKGIVGDWKNAFTDKQNEMFDEYYRNRMKDSKLNIRFCVQKKEPMTLFH